MPPNPPTPVEDRWWPGNQWPATSPEAADAANNPQRLHSIYKYYKSAAFKNWSPGNEAIAFLSEFAVLDSTASGKPDWTDITVSTPARTLTNNTDTTTFPSGKSWDLDEELVELVGLIEYRAGAMSEALQQRDTVIGYYQGILSFTYLSHPYTLRLCHVALVVGQFLAMHFKAKFNRPRPSQLHPALLLPIDVPQHAAYPSGHATEAWLIAYCLDEVMRDGDGGDDKIMKVIHPNGQMRNPLHDMAKRIARNREVMGLHYPSDSEAGKTLAFDGFNILKLCPSIDVLGGSGLLEKARQEWAETKTSVP